MLDGVVHSFTHNAEQVVLNIWRQLAVEILQVQSYADGLGFRKLPDGLADRVGKAGFRARYRAQPSDGLAGLSQACRRI